MFNFLEPYRTTERVYNYVLFYAGKKHIITIPIGFKYRPSVPTWFLKAIGLDLETAYKLSMIHDYLYVEKRTSWSFAEGWLFGELLKRLPIWKVLLVQSLRPISYLYWIT